MPVIQHCSPHRRSQSRGIASVALVTTTESHAETFSLGEAASQALAFGNLAQPCPSIGQPVPKISNAWDAGSPKLNVSACDSVVVTNATDAIPR